MAESTGATEQPKGYDYGAGTLYHLVVLQDVTLEGPETNYNHLDWLIVGLHPDYPKKRFLIQFESPPSGCPPVKWAKMYLHFAYAHKASFMTIYEAPHIPRTLQVYQVLQKWSETEATSKYRLNGIKWNQQYLALDGTDAASHPQDHGVTLLPGRPKGYVEFDVTEAVRNWSKGETNYGLLVMATNENTPGRDLRFWSKSTSDPEKSKYAFISIVC